MLNRFAWAAIALCCNIGCRAQPGDLTVQIQQAVKPDPSCAFAITNPAAISGLYDPRVAASLPGEDGFLLGLLLRNNLEGRADEPMTLDSTTNLRNRFNDMKVVAFEGCWAQDSTGSLKVASSSAVLNCAALPQQSATLPASGELDEGGTAQAVVSVRVLTQPHLRQLFGAGFDPAALKPRGAYTAPGFDGTTLQTFYGIAPAPPGDPATRDPAWGSTYPTTLSAPVIVQLRAVLVSLAGETLRTGWFSFPITVRPGSAEAACGDLVQRQCPLPCADGSACAAGVCPSGPCTYAPQMTGFLNDFYATGACLPAQQGSVPACLTKKQGCPLTYYGIAF